MLEKNFDPDLMELVFSKHVTFLDEKPEKTFYYLEKFSCFPSFDELKELPLFKNKKIFNRFLKETEVFVFLPSQKCLIIGFFINEDTTYSLKNEPVFLRVNDELDEPAFFNIANKFFSFKNTLKKYLNASLKTIII